MNRIESSRWCWVVFAFGLSPLVADEASDAPGSSSGLDPTGTYTWERTRGDRVFTSTLTLHSRDGKLAGTYSTRRGESAVEELTLEGDKISFAITRQFGDRRFKSEYRGTIAADGIKGTIEFTRRNGQTRTLDWHAKRKVAPKDVVGVWNFEIARGEGEKIKTRLKISLAGDRLKGQYTGPRSEREIETVMLSGTELSFAFSGETDSGDEFRVKYAGTVRGNVIAGTVSYDFGGNEGTAKFVGRRETAKETVVGVWHLESQRENGETMKSKLAITADGDKLRGEYESAYGKREAKNVQVKDGVLSFELSGDTDRGSFRFHFEGKLSKGTVKGTVKFEFGDRSGSREFSGRLEAKNTKEPKESDKPSDSSDSASA